MQPTQQQIAKFCFFTACGEESSDNGFNNLVPRATAQFITIYHNLSLLIKSHQYSLPVYFLKEL